MFYKLTQWLGRERNSLISSEVETDEWEKGFYYEQSALRTGPDIVAIQQRWVDAYTNLALLLYLGLGMDYRSPGQFMAED